MSEEPLIKVRNLTKKFKNGEAETTVLHHLDIDIYAGEMIAIIGHSGSGKSTLMNILGCLDRPSEGDYWINGNNTSHLNTQERARLRREYIGFIFQRYHLISDLTASDNVAIPAIYSGMPAADRKARAELLLSRLGLEDKIGNKPSQLSGGQQQRVSIARALMNGGHIIFADEPTGALDTQSGEEVMRILRELHVDGHTIILVTHDPSIAENANRIIEIKDGHIISDENKKASEHKPIKSGSKDIGKKFNFDLLISAFKMAIRSISGHKLRAFLTMLGIIIGIASVVSSVAIGNGIQSKILDKISGLGSNTIDINPGTFGDRRSEKIRTLTPSDAKILSKQSFIESATPAVNASATLKYQNQALSSSINGVGEEYFDVQNIPVTQGRELTTQDIEDYKAVAYLDSSGVKTLFGSENPLGKIIILDNMPVTIIGVVDVGKNARFSNSTSINVWAPYTSIMNRLLGQSYVSQITLRVSDDVSSSVAEDAITRILIKRHGSEDFNLRNSEEFRTTITETSAMISRLISIIAVITLIVGGIGVMNIMLVSVTERTQEIGIRMAVGARQSDIMRQFLIEAVLLCLIGGFIGISLAYGVGPILALANSSFTMIYDAQSVIIAFLCATMIGVLFGYLPAKNASKLDPVQALSSD